MDTHVPTTSYYLVSSRSGRHGHGAGRVNVVVIILSRTYYGQYIILILDLEQKTLTDYNLIDQSDF